MGSETTLRADMTLGEIIENVARTHPNREAVIYGKVRLSYDQLNRRVNSLAAELRRLGITKGQKVATVLPDSPEFIYALFAVARIGGVFVPVNPKLREAEIQYILSNSETVAVITSSDKSQDSRLVEMIEKIRSQLPGLKHILVASGSNPQGTLWLNEEVRIAQARELTQEDVTPDDLAALIYTSGTTGFPKGTMHSHKNLVGPVVATLRIREAWLPKANPESIKRIANVLKRYQTRLLRAAGKQQVLVSAVPCSGIAGIQVVLQILLVGDKLVMMERLDPVLALKIIEREKASIFTTVPTMLTMMLKVQDFDKYDLSSLLVCGTGSAPCPPDLAYELKRRIGCAVLISFGATELGGPVMVSNLEDPDNMQAETVGRVLPGAEIKVVDEDRCELPPGQVGELACRVESVMKGYYRAPEATTQVVDEDGWYFTGDLAVIDERGYARIVGRKKDMIIRGGQNIYPVEIENHLLTHPKIRNVAVIGVPSPVGGERVRAYVVPKDGAELTAIEVIDHCRGKMATYKLPNEVRFVKELPVTQIGKVQKYKLRQLALEEMEGNQKFAFEKIHIADQTAEER